ncbi:MAG: hypothetical protein K0S28_1323 [Paucimonas sp.]|jgi:phospholipid/cholesterol/gamma-HCH transport system permease protein|nr:hypothetical protein [Paucimonas sp.]
MPNFEPPTLAPAADDASVMRASGCWRVQALADARSMRRLQRALKGLPRDARWDLSEVTALDHIGAQWLWNAWGKARPAQLHMPERFNDFFARLEQAGALSLPPAPPKRRLSFHSLSRTAHLLRDHITGFIALLGQVTIDIGRLLLEPERGPWKEISANVFHIGYQALGITALVGFLIGVVLSFLSAQQLHTFGADIYLVNILGMSIIRELGPLLAAILVAGRSGSSITAQLGVMRVTEELDAMLVMGMPHGYRLIMPKVVALAVSMPLLVIWTDAMALAGGIAAGNFELGLAPSYFMRKLPDAVPVANYWIGLLKGITFGGLIALVACHFGMRIKPDTESLGHGTTVSVVTAITTVILADAVFAIVFNNVGYV